MQFHVSGDYAAYFGLKGDINDFAVGGWSMGATYYRLWHAGNDGSGSGLDADLLDGINSGSFLRSDTSDTMSGDLTVAGILDVWDSASIDGFTVWHAGNDGSGSGLDADLLDGQHGSYYLNYNNLSNTPTIALNLADDTSNNITMYPLFYEATSGTTEDIYTSSTKLQYNPSTGTLSATNLNSLSDATKKTNIETIDNALDITTKLRGVRYDWIDNKKSSIGLIAQEVEEILPEIVETSSDNMKTIAYGNLVGLLIESVKDLKSEINTLKQEIEQLKK